MTHEELSRKVEGLWHDSFKAPGYAALRAVVELHKPVLWQKIEMVCDGCGMDIEQNYNSAYPCETIQAIEKELQ